VVHTSCGLGSGHFLPLHGAGGDVEHDSAFEGEAGVCGSVDGETLAHSGAAVVAREDNWMRAGGFWE